jgi:hypothetical protein
MYLPYSKRIINGASVFFTFSILLFSCSKDSTGTGPTPAPAPVQIKIPLTKGTWWKYVRIDSTASAPYYPNGGKHTYDSTIELVTVSGNKTLINGLVAYMLTIQNLTKNKIDSEYISTANGDYSRFTNDMISVLPPAYTYFSTPIYVTNSFFNPDSLANSNRQPQVAFEYYFYRTDTSAVIFGKSFPSSIFVLKNHTTYAPGTQSPLTPNYGFLATIAQGIGFAKYEESSSSGGAYSWTNNYMSRRIIDYYIAP